MEHPKGTMDKVNDQSPANQMGASDSDRHGSWSTCDRRMLTVVLTSPSTTSVFSKPGRPEPTVNLGRSPPTCRRRNPLPPG